MDLRALWTRDERTLRCPDFAPELCAAGGLPDHVREQTFGMARLGLGAALGLGKGFQVGVSLPLVLQRFTIEHRLLDGSPYQVPYSPPVGPSGLLFGLGDLRAVGRLAGRIGATPLILSAGLGAALPTGRTSPNPFDPAIPANQRQYRQLGNGTVDPTVELALSLATAPLGLLVTGGARLPLYANRWGYRGQLQVSGAAGVVARPVAPLSALRLLLLLEATHAGAATWDGAPAPNSGRDALGIRLGFEWAVTRRLALRGSLTAVPLERWEGEQFAQPVSGGLGISGLLDLPRLPRARGGR